MNGMGIRLNKYLAKNCNMSRREADTLIESGKVCINGRVARIGDKKMPDDRVTINKRDVVEQKLIYLALNKPVGYVCSKKHQDDTPTIYELLPKKYQSLKSVGRLDKNSSGLILLTNDGDFAFRMTHPKFAKQKHYRVVIDRELEPLHQQMISDFGIQLSDGRSQMSLVRIGEGRKKWEVIISEGRNRQIRRTFDALGYKVITLHRFQFGLYQLADLPEGGYVEIERGNI